MSKYILQTRTSDTLATTMAAGTNACTLSLGSFGSPATNQIITLDGNVAAKAADFDCAISGTAVTSMTRLNGPDVEHVAGCQVSMNLVDEHYAAKADTAQEAWTGMTLVNSWANYGSGYSTAAYMKDTLGFVHLKGVIKNGNTALTVATLPAGYRPAEIGMFSSFSTTPAIASQLTIDTTGVILVNAGNNAYLTLDGITFKAA